MPERGNSITRARTVNYRCRKKEDGPMIPLIKSVIYDKFQPSIDATIRSSCTLAEIGQISGSVHFEDKTLGYT